MKLDSKFSGVIIKAKDSTVVPDDEYVVFLAKDNAFAAILPAYHQKCLELGCSVEQVASVNRLIMRVQDWRYENPERCKDPDIARGEKMLDGK